MDATLGLNGLPFEGLDLYKAIPGAGKTPDDGSAPVTLDPERVKVAREFESILLTRLMEQMKESIGKWGLEGDAASEQIQGIFWMHLAQEMGSQGGIGLWRGIYEFMNHSMPDGAPQQMDQSL